MQDDPSRGPNGIHAVKKMLKTLSKKRWFVANNIFDLELIGLRTDRNKIDREWSWISLYIRNKLWPFQISEDIGRNKDNLSPILPAPIASHGQQHHQHIVAPIDQAHDHNVPPIVLPIDPGPPQSEQSMNDHDAASVDNGMAASSQDHIECNDDHIMIERSIDQKSADNANHAVHEFISNGDDSTDDDDQSASDDEVMAEHNSAHSDTVDDTHNEHDEAVIVSDGAVQSDDDDVMDDDDDLATDDDADHDEEDATEHIADQQDGNMVGDDGCDQYQTETFTPSQREHVRYICTHH